MKIYISGTFTAQQRLRAHADALRAMGHEVISTWLYEPARPAHLNPATWNEELADKDIAEVFSADCVILDLDGASTTGGRYVEWGLACYPGALKLRFVVCGEPAPLGVFEFKAHKRFLSWTELLAFFEENHQVEQHGT